MFKPSSPLAAVAWGQDRIDLFGVAEDNAIWHRAGIEPAAPRSILGSEVDITTGTTPAEITAAVIPPGSHYPGTAKGKVIFSLGQAINGPFMILRADLGVSGTPKNIDAAIKPSPVGSNTITIGTDNQITHLPNGDLLLARNAGITFDILPK